MGYASAKDLTLLRKLKQRKYREKEGLFVAEGHRVVEQLESSSYIRIRKKFVLEGKEPDGDSGTFHLIKKEDAKDIFDTESPQGLLAICEMPEQLQVEALSAKEGVIVACDRLQDPGNMGTIIRTATWFGASGLLLGEGSVDVFNPKVVRSTMGALGNVPVTQVNLSQELDRFEKEGWTVLLLDGNTGATELSDITKSEKTILVVGNEANGLDKDLMQGHRERVMIPAVSDTSSVESLNAAVALSIALYEVSSGQTY